MVAPFHQPTWCALSPVGQSTIERIDVFAILMGIVGGLALFLFGMDRMSDSLKLFAGK
jgi:hypothetical protein